MRWYAAAAALLLLIGAWQHSGWFRFGEGPRIDLAYQHVESGATLQWLSRNVQALPDLSAARFGVPLVLNDAPPDVHVLGIIELPNMPEALGLLAEVKGETVLLIARRSGIMVPEVPIYDCHLDIRERRLGDATLYEITPLRRSRLLNAVQIKGAAAGS